MKAEAVGKSNRTSVHIFHLLENLNRNLKINRIAQQTVPKGNRHPRKSRK
ncbi:MAG: hypothetical protein II840_07610 [Kiritimatiellae bacterium]|nr:hypothetical protein [Kiritimatiellia bacterium]